MGFHYLGILFKCILREDFSENIKVSDVAEQTGGRKEYTTNSWGFKQIIDVG